MEEVLLDLGWRMGAAAFVVVVAVVIGALAMKRRTQEARREAVKRSECSDRLRNMGA